MELKKRAQLPKRQSWIGLILVVFAALWLAACSAPPTPAPIALPSATLSPAPIQTLPPTPAPQPTQTLAPSSTPKPTTPPEPSTTPTSSATPAPSATPMLSPTVRPGEATSVCLDPSTTPRPLSARKTPLEVWFNNADDIWLWTEKDGLVHQVTQVGDARNFSPAPDGQVVVFERGVDQEHVELWAVNRDGSNLRKLVSTEKFDSFGSDPQAVANAPTFDHWNPGEHSLVFSVYSVIHKPGGCCTVNGYWSVNADTGQLVRGLPPHIPPYGLNGLLSPDGKQAAILEDTHLDLVNADGKNLRKNVLTYPHFAAGEGPSSIKPTVIWASDSQSLHTVVIDGEPFADNPTFSAWSVPATGQPAKKLATFEGFPLSVHLSPDQATLAYWRRVEPMSNVREMHLARFDGSKDTVYLVSNLLDIFGWAPDGLHIAYTDYDTGAQLGSLCGAAVPLTDMKSARQLGWVDGKRFLFVGGPQEHPELRLGQIGGASILIGPFTGKSASYQYNIEKAALGE